MFMSVAQAYSLVMFLALILAVVLGFDLRTSRPWQLALYHLMLVLFALGSFLLSVRSGSMLMGRKLRWGLVVVALLAVAAVAWSNGWTGLRGEGLIGLVVVFIGFWAIPVVFACGLCGMLLLWAPLARRCLAREHPESV